jgi:phage terminase small subunit
MTIKDKTMSQRKAEFVQHYLTTKNATESARRCGYSEKSSYNQGYRLMKDDEVKKMLTFELAESKERHLKDHDSLIDRLKEEALGDVSGHTGGSRLKALELLMKYYGMIDDKQKLEVNMAENGWFESLDFIEKDSLN